MGSVLGVASVTATKRKRNERYDLPVKVTLLTGSDLTRTSTHQSMVCEQVNSYRPGLR